MYFQYISVIPICQQLFLYFVYCLFNIGISDIIQSGDNMNRIRELRKDGGYKQIDFCKMLGISQATLSGYETGRYQPDNEMLLKIASMFDVSIDYILGNSDKKSALT